MPQERAKLVKPPRSAKLLLLFNPVEGPYQDGKSPPHRPAAAPAAEKKSRRGLQARDEGLNFAAAQRIRETGESPVQSRCCKSLHRRSIRGHCVQRPPPSALGEGRSMTWEGGPSGDKPENLPSLCRQPPTPPPAGPRAGPYIAVHALCMSGERWSERALTQLC